jgi:hypothetical protein
MGFRRFVATPTVLALMVVMALAVPAQATVFDSGPISFQDSFEEDLCGIAVRHDVTVSGHFRTRTGKGDLDQAFFGQGTVNFTDTFTNLATGASFSIEGTVIDKDVKATPLGGNVFEFRFQEAGTVVVRDMDGNVVLRDSGVFRTTIVFDTLGDSLPGGEVLEETVDRVSGPHPLFEMDEAAFCDMVHDLIG